MKNLIITLILLISFTNLQAQKISLDSLRKTCKKIKIKKYPALGNGYVIHYQYKKKKTFNIFIHTESLSDTTGWLLNQADELESHKMKMRSVGPDFFTVRVWGKSWVYKYSFRTGSWTKMKAIKAPATR